MHNTEQNKYADELIIDYLSGDLSEKQLLELNDWLAADDSHKKHLHQMTEIWLSSTINDAKEGNKEFAYQHFRQRIANKKPLRSSMKWTQIAAVLIIALLLTGTGIYIGKSFLGNSDKYILQTMETPLGSRSRLVLHDGTIVWLNAGSKLTYPTLFAEKRELYLEGEAYFEVSPDKKKPFTVHTSEIDVEVLGTKFSVRDFADDDDIEVILAEGSVNFVNRHDTGSSFVMTPSQQVIYNKTNREVNIHKVPVIQANVWTTGAQFFNELTFHQVSKILEKSFDVMFIFRDEKKRDIIFYADFKSDDTLEYILETLSKNQKFNYTITEDIIEIF